VNGEHFETIDKVELTAVSIFFVEKKPAVETPQLGCRESNPGLLHYWQQQSLP
jgi:hypothetical protein